MGVNGQPFRSLGDVQTLRLLVQNLPAGVYVTTPAGEILDANPGLLGLFELSSLDELRRHSTLELLVDPEQRREELALLERNGFVRDFEFQIRCPRSGVIRTVLDTCYVVRDPSSLDLLFHGILVDISERKSLEEKLKQLAIRDPLTGCFNRRFLADLERTLTAQPLPWGTIVIDIDHFKAYNDTHGHKAGDDVLIRVSRYLMRQVRAEDAVVRIGGDEFLVVIVEENAGSTEAVVRRLSEQGDEAAPFPFSLGCAVRERGETLEQTIHRADRELIRVRIQDRRPQRRRRSSDASPPVKL